MFMHAKEFSSDISRWNVGNAETMAHMFYNAANFNSELADWDTARDFHFSFRIVNAPPRPQRHCTILLTGRLSVQRRVSGLIWSSPCTNLVGSASC